MISAEHEESFINLGACHAPNTATLGHDGSIHLELLCSSIRRLPPNRANEVALFEGTPFGT